MSNKEINKYVNENFEFDSNKQRYVIRVAAYIRVSSQEQKIHGLSIEAQKMKLQEYADKHDMKIVEWYMDEGVSGRKLIRLRPQLQRMINDAKKEKFDRIIFIKLDRYFRSVAEYHECQKILNEHNVTWTATEEKYDLTTANGRAFVNMKLAIAELEADTTSERIKIVNDYKVKQGIPLTGNQCYPFCFHNAINEETGKKSVKLNPEYLDAAHEMIEHFIKYQSVRKTLNYINNKYNLSLRYLAIRNTLENTMLHGMYRGNPNYCEALIDVETFDKIQYILKNNLKDIVSYGTKRDYIFSGLLKCPCCGCKLTGSIHNKTSTAGNKFKYKVYRCNNAKVHSNCDFKKIIYEKKTEKMMLLNIEDFFEKAKSNKVAVESSKEAIKAKSNIEDIQQEIDRLNYSWQKGRIKSVEDYDKQYDELMVKMGEALEHQVEEECPVDYEEIEKILNGDWKTIYSKLDDEHRQAFWRSFVKEVIFDNDKKLVEAKFF